MPFLPMRSHILTVWSQELLERVPLDETKFRHEIGPVWPLSVSISWPVFKLQI